MTRTLALFPLALLVLPLSSAPSASARTPPLLGRIAGDDRIGTAIALSQAGWATPPVDTVLVARADAFPAALAAGSLTQPIMLVNPARTELPAEHATFLAQHRHRFDAVFIFGGTGAVPTATKELVASALGVPPQDESRWRTSPEKCSGTSQRRGCVILCRR